MLYLLSVSHYIILTLCSGIYGGVSICRAGNLGLMGRAAWSTTVRGVARVGHSLVTKLSSPPPMGLKAA